MTDAEKARLWDLVAPRLRMVDPIQRDSPETESCVFCHAEAHYEYYGREAPRVRKVVHAEGCPWRMASRDFTAQQGCRLSSRLRPGVD